MKSHRIFFFIVLYILGLSEVTAQVVANAISQPNEKFKIELPKDLKDFDTSTGGMRFKNVSAYTAMFLGEYKRIKSLPNISWDSALKSVKIRYGIRSLQGKDYISAFILLENKENIISLINLGVKVNGEPKNLITALIPIDIIELVSVLPYIKHIEIGTPVYKNDIISRSQSRADSVNKGILLPSGYNGKGVVVGIIDEGFDFTHPNFYDSLGRVYRIKRVWNQKDNTGTSPNGFDYGSEYTTTAQILSKKTDNASENHGSHVTGLAAGSGFGYPDSLKGISNEAEIVLVATTFQKDAISDALEYILNYSNSVNKPLVINTSLGSQNGPHDGSSLYDINMDTLLSLGKRKSLITVGSSGNAAEANIHTNAILKVNDSIRFSFLKPYQYKTGWSDPNKPYIWTSIYGDVSKNLKFYFGIYNIKNRAWENYSEIYDLKKLKGFNTESEFLNSGISINYLISIGEDKFSSKVNAFLAIDTSYQTLYNLDSNKVFTIGYVSSDNNVHSWIVTPHSNGGDNPSFISDVAKNYINVVDGDNNITIGEIGGTGKSIISVGSFNSSSAGGTLGKIASTSSKGYTVDGRVKPDISASGNPVISSFNSWNEESTYAYLKYQFKGRQYPYERSSGTSMASPVVAGVVGLWLQACPLLSSNQAKYIIQQTAIRDNFTGITPNNSYGYGKINAYGGIKLLLSLMPQKPKLAPNAKDTLICSKDTFTLKAPSGYASYLWYNGTDLVGTTSIPTYKIRTAGSYFCAVQGNNGYWSSYSDTVNIRFDTIPVFPSITISTTQNNCTGIQNYLLTSTPGFTYQWYKNDTLIIGANSKIFSPISSGFYKVLTTSKNNTCTFLSDSVSITKIVPNLNRLFNNDTIKICGSDSVNLIPITNYNSYLWSTGSTKDMIAVKTTGLYKLSAYCGISSNNNVYEQFSSSNNSTKYITVPNASQLNFTNEMSILLKTRIEGPFGNSTLFEKGNDAYRLILDANSSALRFSYTNIDNTVGLKYTLTPSQVQNADWFYIGIVKRSDSSFFYVNGLLVDKAKTTNPIPVNANNLIFGTGIFPNAGRYNGSMDDISLWNRALSQNEVSQYGKCLQGSETGCVGYYNFEGTNPMLDRTIYTNNAIQNGTISNYPINQITSCSPLEIRDSIFVSIINPSVSPKNAIICINSPLLITSKIQTSPVKRLWSSGDTTTSIVVKPKSDIIYSIIMSDNYQSCTDSTVIQVSAPNTAIEIIGKKTFCQGDSAILFAPSINNKFQWLRNNIPIGGETKSMFTARTNGSYRVICFNTSGCSDTSAAIMISVNQNPIATVLPSGPVSFCAGDSILLTASAGLLYQWYQNGNAISIFSPSIYASSAGNYHVVIVDSNGCRSSTSNTVKVNVNPLPVVFIKNPAKNFICQGGSLILNASGNFKYQWLNNSLPIAGATDSNYTAYTGGVFSINIIDSNGCKNSSANQIPINLIKRVKPDFNVSSRCISDLPRIKNLTDTIKAGALQWNWKFGSNETSTLFEPVLTISTPQTLTLSLKVLPANCPELADSMSRIYQFDVAPPAALYPVVDAKKMVPVKLMARNIGIGYQWVPPVGLDTSTIISPRATLSSNQIYFIRITTNSGCIVTDTLKVRMVNNYGVFVPSGFSPDGDGVNDILRPICVGIKELRYFKVLNRWGQLLFETNQMFDGWDGNYNGRPQPPDTYVWAVEALDIDGNLIRLNGKSTLIR